jgi:predicted nucleic acid-binding protein
MERFYLDTNIIFSYFLKKFAERKGKQIEAKVANFLIHSSKKVSYAVSILTKAEIMRKLRSEFGLREDEVINMWKGFILDVSPLYISVSQPLEEIYEEIINIVVKLPIKRRVTNLEHLIIAKKNDLIFVTGDKEIIEKCRRFYNKIWSYNKLRKYYENMDYLNYQSK